MNNSPDPYADRDSYRALHTAADLKYYRIRVEETDLHIGTRGEFRAEALALTIRARHMVEEAIAARPRFATTLSPLEPHGSEPPLILEMLQAGKDAAVGPMAAVAGAIAAFVGRGLRELSPCGIVENGGDLFLWGDTPRTVAVFAGSSPLSGLIGLRVVPGPEGCSVCTSSGTVGHSLSLGQADAAVILSDSAALADAAATALGNFCPDSAEPEEALDRAMAIPGVKGALVILGETLAMKGQLEPVPLSGLRTNL